MQVILIDPKGNRLAITCEAMLPHAGVQEVLTLETLDQIASRMGGPTSSATPAQAATASTPGEPLIKLKYVEPDPRNVKCPVCPHMASSHTDSGCCQTNVADREFRSPGAQGYCKCSRTYKQVMLSHKEAALAEGFTE